MSLALPGLANSPIWLVARPHSALVQQASQIDLALSETRPSITLSSATLSSERISQQAQQGKVFYESGQYLKAIATWQQLLTYYQTQGSDLDQARIWSHLVLAYQALGQWDDASQAIESSRQQLPEISDSNASKAELTAHAQIWNNHANFQFNRGQFEAALMNWRKAEGLYQRLGNSQGVVQAQLNQAEALYDLGFYQRAVALLTNIEADLEAQPSPFLELVTLRRLGNLLRLVKQLEASQAVLARSLTLAEELRLPEEIGETLINLGHTARAQADVTAADAYYQQASELTLPAETALRNQLAQLNLWVSTEQFDKALQQWPAILTQLDQLSASHTGIYSRIQFVQNLTKLRQNTGEGADEVTLGQVLAKAVQQARTIGDRRAESYALGSLGGLYEQTQQWESATGLTRNALSIAQTLDIAELIYPWQWQLGRLLNQQGQREDAIASYREAVNHLGKLRGELANINSDIQFSFQERVEPIYRELVALLLQPDAQQKVSQVNLEEARDTIESLQLAELDDYFKEACLDVQPIQIDDVDPQAAIFYPILLGDRLEIILRLPGQSLAHYTTPVVQTEVETLTTQLRQALVIRSRRNYLTLSQQLYDWLVRPALNDLKNSGVNTLVFVLDQAFQNVPMATLHDGQHFLIEDYSVALTPGLKLLSSQPIPRDNLKILAAGLSEGRQGFSPLSYVDSEIEAIKSAISQGEVLLNQSFTREALTDELKASTFPIVHIATHGQFSSKAEDTFLLSWENRINVTELDQILKNIAFNKETPIELLVLSACQTAAGDKRAALGLAGTAVKAGARSTVATLWSVNDEATAVLMNYFYQALTERNVTKAQALRQAQLKLLKSPQYQHPVYWSPYILLGNWL
ncbi:MAG: CHAT domain-containing protein [Cyanobacteria bacterium P01_D01_bin.105]